MPRFLLLYALLICAAAPVRADESKSSPAQPAAKVSPHDGKAPCAVCHEAPEEDLRSWFTFTSTKRKLKGGADGLCLACHAPEFGHGVGKTPEMNKMGLPLDDAGRISCVRTCHNLHLEDPKDRIQKKYHLRLTQDDLCISCHNK